MNGLTIVLRQFWESESGFSNVAKLSLKLSLVINGYELSLLALGLNKWLERIFISLFPERLLKSI